MVPGSPTRAARSLEPLFDIHPRTGASIEVFYADRTLETFGRCGAGWFWWSSPAGLFARRSGDRSVCYELRSVSACDEPCGTDRSALNAARMGRPARLMRT